MKPEIPKVLSSEEIERIHCASVEILETTGVMIQAEELAQSLAAAGARREAGKGIVRFPRSLTERLLGKAPPVIELFRRGGGAPLAIGHGETRSVAGYDAPFFYDQDIGERRPITKAEVGDFAWLADRLENVDIVGNQGIPQDVPPETEEAHAVAALLENTGKHLIVAPDTPKAARAIYKMVAAAAGTEQIGLKPVVSCHVSPSSPLRWTPKACHIILETVQRGLPFLILPAPMAGATAPVTLAGQLTVHNTEVLSGYLIAQILREGHPVVYCNAHTIFNMREGNPLIATPETLLLRIAGGQMARFYKIPSHSIGFDSDAHLSDPQNAWEKALTAMACVQGRLDLMVNLGMFETGLAVSYAQLLMDAELFGFLKRFARGMEAGEEHVAKDIINKVGSWGAYLEEEHTLRHFREENWYPELSCRKLFDPWRKEGARDIVQVAHARAVQMLQEERKPYIDARTKKDIEKIIEREFAS